MPFCNLDFRNPWQLKGPLPCEPLPPDRWWCNADILCTKPATARGWTIGPLPTYKSMICEALHQHPVRYSCFFLNRRDHPLVRRDGSYPYHHPFAGTPPRVLREPESLLPVLSPYTDSVTFHDRLIPTDVCWKTIRENCHIQMRPWQHRHPVAFFRGTATNPLRTELVRVFADHTNFDVALTHSSGGRLRVMKGVVERQAASGDAETWVPPSHWDQYRVILAVDGHCGLNRWAYLVRSGAWIVRISGSVAPEAWMASVVPHVHIDGTTPTWTRDLENCVARLISRDHGPRRVPRLWDRMVERVAKAMLP